MLNISVMTSASWNDVSVLYSVSNAAGDVSILYQQSSDSPSANQTSSIFYQVPPKNNTNSEGRHEYSDIPSNDSSAYEEIENHENAVSKHSNTERARTDEIYEEPNDIRVKRFDTAFSRCLWQRNLLTMFYLKLCFAKQALWPVLIQSVCKILT